jgi:hypothetical protein
MRMLFTLALLFGLSLSAAQAPLFEGETLNGKHTRMPAAIQGRTALLLVGFSQASAKQTEDWAKRTKGLCETWSMAVLESVPRLLRGVVSRGIRSGIPQEQYDHFLLVFNGERELKQAAGFRGGGSAYVLLIAADGSVKWRFEGPVTDDAVSQLRRQLD